MQEFEKEALEYLLELFQGSKGAYETRKVWYDELTKTRGAAAAMAAAKELTIEPAQKGQLRGLIGNVLLTTMNPGNKLGLHLRALDDALMPTY